MPDFVTQAQLDMLAETLDVEPAELAHLGRLGAARLHALRNAISDRLFDAQAAMFARVSKLAPLVPNSLVAKLAPVIVPPLVAGRAAGTLGIDHQNRIADLLARLPAGYMADCAPHMDPRTIAVLAPIVDGDTLLPGAVELMRRRDYLTCSRFVEFATPALITAFEQGLDDDLGLLHTAALTYATEQLQLVIAAMPDSRLDRIMRASLTDKASALAGLSVVARLEPEQRTRLRDQLIGHVRAASDEQRELLTQLRAELTGDEAALADEIVAAVG